MRVDGKNFWSGGAAFQTRRFKQNALRNHRAKAKRCNAHMSTSTAGGSTFLSHHFPAHLLQPQGDPFGYILGLRRLHNSKDTGTVSQANCTWLAGMITGSF